MINSGIHSGFFVVVLFPLFLRPPSSFPLLELATWQRVALAIDDGGHLNIGRKFEDAYLQ